MQISFASSCSVIGESKKLGCLPSRTNALPNCVVSEDNALSSIDGTILYTHFLRSSVSSSQYICPFAVARKGEAQSNVAVQFSL